MGLSMLCRLFFTATSQVSFHTLAVIALLQVVSKLVPIPDMKALLGQDMLERAPQVSLRVQTLGEAGKVCALTTLLNQEVAGSSGNVDTLMQLQCQTVVIINAWGGVIDNAWHGVVDSVWHGHEDLAGISFW